MKRYSRSLFSFTAFLFILYTGICIYFWFIQDEIIFRPDRLPHDYTYSYSFEYEERWFEGDDGARIHALLAKSDSARGLVIYFHGNGGSTNTSEEKFRFFLDQGYDVLYPDYREYGKSTGELKNGKDLTGDMNRVYRSIKDEYGEDRITVLGYSLGSGVAASVASENNPRQLILWTPYYSMVDMKNTRYPYLPDFLVRFPLRTDLYLQQVDEPVTIFYAADDEVLPLSRSMKLNELLKEKDRYILLKKQGHRSLYRNNELRREMNKLLQ